MSKSCWSWVALSLALGFTLASGASAQARAFEIRNDGGSRIQFVSDAPLETITGVSSHVTGELNVDPANLAAARGRVAVQIASIRTGVDLRDEHLRSSMWLDAGSHPQATLEITQVEGATALTPNQMQRVRIRGRFTLHGQTREIVADTQVRLVPMSEELRAAHIDGDVIRAQASFRIRLSDYGVSIPAVVQLKVANEVEVNVTIRAIARRS